MITEFIIESTIANPSGLIRHSGIINIIGKKPNNKPYVKIRMGSGFNDGCIKDKDLERFAVNILKALKSKKLK